MSTSFTRLFPLFKSLQTYHLGWFKKDVAAGLTTAIVLIPQSMAYALLAGLPPHVGLYAAAVPLLAYALLGTSPTLAVGPVAMDSLLTATAIGALAQVGSDQYLLLASMLALLVGLIQIVFGLLRAGFLVNALSQPVIAGFTAAAAFIIGLNQLKLLTGISLDRTTAIDQILLRAFEKWQEIHTPTLALGLGAIFILVLLKKFRPTYPRALLVLLVGGLAVFFLGLSERGVAIIGTIPAGLPSMKFPTLEWDLIASLLPSAFTIAVVAFVEAMSVAKGLNRPEDPELNANQELAALGSANLTAGLFGAYPVTGGFSRSAVNANAGAKTQVAALVTAAAVAITATLFTPLIALVPTAVLGAIIVTAVAGLIDLKRVGHFWRVRRSDFWLYCLTFAATLILGIQTGIFVGVVVSLLWFIAATSKPHIATLGRIPGTRIYRNILRHPEAIQSPGQLIVRFDAPLFFANTAQLKHQLKMLESALKQPLNTIILDASGIGRIDTTGADLLSQMALDFKIRNIDFRLACLRGPVRDVLTKAGFFEVCSEERLLAELHCLPDKAESSELDVLRQLNQAGCDS